MNLRSFLLICLAGCLLFLPFLGHVHLFDWDEINFAESAREMLLTKNFGQVQINFHPFWEKPPLFIWLQAASMSLFGVNEFAARLPNAVVGIITLLTLLYVGSRQVDAKFGWLWVMCYAGSFLPHFYFKSGIIDPLFNLFIFCGMLQFARLTDFKNRTKSQNSRISALAGLFIGLAVLTKGPVALLITLFCLLFYWISVRFKPFIRLKYIVIFIVVAGIVSSAWFALETIRNGPWFLLTFIQYQIRLLTTEDAGHGGPFYYHFIVLLLGCFPASIFALTAFRSEVHEAYEVRNFKKWMALLLLVVLIIFSIVKTKIVHYSSLAYFPVTFLAAYTLHKLMRIPERKASPVHLTGIAIIGILIALACVLTPIAGMHPGLLLPYIHDAFGRASLQATVPWSMTETLIGFFYLAVIVLGIFWLRKRDTKLRGAMVLFTGTALCLQLVLFFFVPKVERYSQGAAIDFITQKSGEKAMIDVLGYKSYAHLFYGNRRLPADTTLLNKDTLLQRKSVSLPVYFVTKIDKADEFISRYGLQKVGEGNGFVFLRKETR